MSGRIRLENGFNMWRMHETCGIRRMPRLAPSVLSSYTEYSASLQGSHRTRPAGSGLSLARKRQRRRETPTNLE
jgi:hypothetical protein